MRIVLWDIDGTLLNTGGAGMRALAGAVGASAGAAGALRRLRLGGMTDRKIARMLCAAERHQHVTAGSPDDHMDAVQPAEIDHVLGQYLAALRGSLSESSDFRILPGVFECLDALEGQVVHALGTGNVEEGARLKLEHGGLWRRFAFGGYGSDAEERPDILRAAWSKAETHVGRTLAADDFVVVGDTPRDVTAAHAVGIACVAVATGGYPVNELSAHAPEAILASLADPRAPGIIRDARRR